MFCENLLALVEVYFEVSMLYDINLSDFRGFTAYKPLLYSLLTTQVIVVTYFLSFIFQ